MKPCRKSKHESGSWSLSLVKSEDEKEERPVPLAIHLPEGMAADNKLRPRRFPSLFPVPPAHDVRSSCKFYEETVRRSCLRRSSRLSAFVGQESATVGPIGSVETESDDKIENKDSNCRINKVRTFVDDKSLRRSPRFPSTSAEAQSGRTLSLSIKVLRKKGKIFPQIGNICIHILACSLKNCFCSIIYIFIWDQPARGKLN